MDREALDELLQSDLIDAVSTDDLPASNIAVAGQEKIMVEAMAAPGNVLRFWIVADNLKLMAQTAVACAAKLLRMRPSSVVQ